MFKTFVILLIVATAAESRRSKRVVNGKQVGRLVGDKVQGSAEFDFIVQVIWKANGDTYKCGGALIRRDVVLTAGHCVYQAKEPELTIKAGMVNQKLQKDTAEKRKVKKILVNKNFQTKLLVNDIAILILYKAFPKTRFINSIELPTPADYKTGNEATIAGWGITEFGVPSEWLRKVDLKIIPNEVCQLFITTRTIPQTAVRALNQQVGGACDGDSGGPLVYDDKVIGISSFTWSRVKLPNGRETCNPKTPSIFTRVSEFLPWINKKLSQNPFKE